MLYSFLADIIVLVHLLFVLFALLGGFLILWKRSVAWFHIPAVFWAVCIEFLGWICPLTPLENILRIKAGGAGYETGFVEQYIMPILYPVSLTRSVQIGLGILVLSINIGIYLLVWYRLRQSGEESE